MADTIVIMPNELDKWYDVKSGAIRLKYRCFSSTLKPTLSLYAEETLHQEYFKIVFGEELQILNRMGQVLTSLSLHNFYSDGYQEFWVCWHDRLLRIGKDNVLISLLKVEFDEKIHIRYAHFGESNSNTNMMEWVIDIPPCLKYEPLNKVFEDDLRWVKMSVNDQLPEGAMIGGFEEEPVYIIRAFHNKSLCPGKFLSFSKKASVPWGHEEHSKEEFEILCGYNVHWVNTSSNKIPGNAVEAGYSEVRQESLYIGRAMHDKYLLVGKVHAFYGSCYLPYKDLEIEVEHYQILIKGGPSESRALID